MAASIVIRHANETDAQPLLMLMRELAAFEGYLQEFCVTEADLLSRGLTFIEEGQFIALVAQTTKSRELCGYAVIYEIPFTFDLKPTLVLKELYVREQERNLSIGQCLMEAVMAYGRSHGCARLKWEVLPGNEAAKRFYRRFGATKDAGWENWIVKLSQRKNFPV